MATGLNLIVYPNGGADIDVGIFAPTLRRCPPHRSLVVLMAQLFFREVSTRQS